MADGTGPIESVAIFEFLIGQYFLTWEAHYFNKDYCAAAS
jgi:hypothetical protein